MRIKLTALTVLAILFGAPAASAQAPIVPAGFPELQPAPIRMNWNAARVAEACRDGCAALSSFCGEPLNLQIPSPTLDQMKACSRVPLALLMRLGVQSAGDGASRRGVA